MQITNMPLLLLRLPLPWSEGRVPPQRQPLLTNNNVTTPYCEAFLKEAEVHRFKACEDMKQWELGPHQETIFAENSMIIGIFQVHKWSNSINFQHKLKLMQNKQLVT